MEVLTNFLIEKAKEYTSNNSKIEKKDLDFLLSTGEMQTASLLSLMLNSKGYSSVCLTGAQAGIITDSLTLVLCVSFFIIFWFSWSGIVLTITPSF